MKDKVIVIFDNARDKNVVDIEIPLDITAKEMIAGLNQAYALGINTESLQECHMQSENPIALLRGNKTMQEFGIRDGSIIHFTE